MSRHIRRIPPDQGDQRPSASSSHHRKRRGADENMSDHSSKRANFSAISSNGLNRNLNILNLKPTATKKLVIKNLKSKLFAKVLKL